MDSLGDTIRNLREGKELPLRTVAAYLDIDQAILSKIERGQRNASRDQVKKLASYFKVKLDDLLVAWLSDKLVYELEDEAVALQALQVAEEKISYAPMRKINRTKVFQSIGNYLKQDGRVAKAWVFGSFARGEQSTKSDLDLMVRFKKLEKLSLFDYADIAYQIEKIINIKVDLVEESYLRPFAQQTAAKDLTLIYG